MKRTVRFEGCPVCFSVCSILLSSGTLLLAWQRYKQLLHYAQQLTPLAPQLHTPENKVRGCVSQVWLVGELQADGTVQWLADSDSQLTKVRDWQGGHPTAGGNPKHAPGQPRCVIAT